MSFTLHLQIRFCALFQLILKYLVTRQECKYDFLLNKTKWQAVVKAIFIRTHAPAHTHARAHAHTHVIMFGLIRQNLVCHSVLP